VRAQIAAKNFPGAIDELKRLNDSGDADWNNLMGYSLRKARRPISRSREVLQRSAAHRPQAPRRARILGELYLQTGDIAKAEQRLAALDKACRFGCSEYSDLKKAIAQYKRARQGLVELLRLFPRHKARSAPCRRLRRPDEPIYTPHGGSRSVRSTT